jgi:hypothetical protein
MKTIAILLVLSLLACSDLDNGTYYIKKKTQEVLAEGQAYKDSVKKAKRYYLMRDIHGRCIYQNSFGDTLDIQEDHYFHCADSLTNR